MKVLSLADGKQPLRALDLFSGIGGFALGFHMAGIETAAFCEKEEYCQKVLTKNFPEIPIFNDIKELHFERKGNDIAAFYQKSLVNYFGKIDIVCGGFPCQPFSIAGKQRAEKDDRDLWPEMFRVIKEIRPTWVVGENVAQFINLGFTRTKVDLESIGYAVLPFEIPACAVGARHERKRNWIVAHLDSPELRLKSGRSSGEIGKNPLLTGLFGEFWDASNINNDRSQSSISSSTTVKEEGLQCERISKDESTSNTNGNRLSQEPNASTKKDKKGEREGNGRTETTIDIGSGCGPESKLVRVIHGVSPRLDRDSEAIRRKRVAALGNSVVPHIPAIIGSAIRKIEESKELLREVVK